jgi:hypothetical protein
MQPEEADRYNRLDRAWFHEGARALLGAGRDDFIALQVRHRAGRRSPLLLHFSAGGRCQS